MPASAVEWLVFDLGGVLIEVEPPADTLSRIAAHGQVDPDVLREPLRGSCEQPPLSLAERYMAGEMDTGSFCDRVDEYLDRPLGCQALQKHVRDMLLGVFPDTVALLEKLSTRHATACYSNTNAIHWDYALQEYPLFQSFRQCMASHEVGLVKPDPAVFAYVEKQLAAKPGACVLIDDREHNVAAACAAGWQGVHFTSATRLAEQLATLGVA